MGVDLFLVLSGFLITGILYDSKYGTGYFSKFYARRVLRIFPLYFTFLLVMLLLVDILRVEGTVPSIRYDFGWHVPFLTNVRLAVGSAHAADLPVTAHLWSVAVEEQFYLIWPAVVLLCNRRLLIPMCGVAIAVALISRTIMAFADVNVWFGYTLMPARMDALAVGALIALLAREPDGLRQLVRWAPVVGACSLAAVIALGIHATAMSPFDLGVRTFGYTLIALLFGALLVFAVIAAPATLAHRFFGSSVMRTLGRYSYALYVVHVPIGYYLSRRIDIAAKFPTVLGSSLPGEAAFVIAAFIPTFLVAWLSWQLLESPFLRLKRYFSYSTEETNAAPATLVAPTLAGGD